jgi:hypothetical protein
MKAFYFFLSILLFCSPFAFSQNYVSTFSGNINGNAGFQNGPVSTSTFNNPFGMCMDKHGNLFIAEANNCIRKIDRLTGMVSTYAGSGIAGWKDGYGDTAQFRNPSDICVDDSGNIYVCDFENQRIRKIDTNRMVTTVAGNGVAGYVNGTTNARFNYPRGICVDTEGNLYIGDSWNHRIRKIDRSGNVTTIAGGGIYGLSTTGSLIDGQDTSARFYTPCGVTIDGQKNIYVADAYNHRIRKIDSLGMVTTLAGSGATGQGNGGNQNGNFGNAIFNTPTEVTFDTLLKKLFISDTFGNRIRVADLNSSTVSNFAGSGASGYVDGVDSLASFNYPRAMTIDTSGDIFVCDFTNNSIRLISPNIGSGIIEMENTQVFIYPNPSSGIFTVSFTNDAKHSMEVFDIKGIKINEFLLQGTEEINIHDNSNGIYFLRIDKYKVLRIIID